MAEVTRLNLRDRLPNRRRGERRQFYFRGKPYSLTAGYYLDGRLGEVFVDCSARGLQPVDSDAKDAAVCLSIALQYGAPPQVIRDAVTRLSNGEPTGIIGCVLDVLLNEGES